MIRGSVSVVVSCLRDGDIDGARVAALDLPRTLTGEEFRAIKRACDRIVARRGVDVALLDIIEDRRAA